MNSASRDGWDNSAYRKTYGSWAGSPKGFAPDYTRCCENVGRDMGRFTQFGQCLKPRGHGPGGAYCKIHDPSAVATKRAARDAAYAAERVASSRRWALEALGREAIVALRQIKDGHNDPRTLAAETLAEFDAKYPTA